MATSTAEAPGFPDAQIKKQSNLTQTSSERLSANITA